MATRQRRDKWFVSGEYGGTFTNLKAAKACAKAASLYEDTYPEPYTALVELLDDGCNYIEYHNGKCVRDGWTINKYSYKHCDMEGDEK